ncbi:hypothetical protein J3F83DRAFT_748234 [Trichoderma novae-zelandiae]
MQAHILISLPTTVPFILSCPPFHFTKLCDTQHRYVCFGNVRLLSQSRIASGYDKAPHRNIEHTRNTTCTHMRAKENIIQIQYPHPQPTSYSRNLHPNKTSSCIR